MQKLREASKLNVINKLNIIDTPSGQQFIYHTEVLSFISNLRQLASENETMHPLATRFVIPTQFVILSTNYVALSSRFVPFDRVYKS